MKYSKKDRENAILICDISASYAGRDHMYGRIAEDLGLDCCGLAISLACDALCAASPAECRTPMDRFWPREDDALAAQMLREGWTP